MHLTPRRKDAKTPGTSKNKELSFYPKDFCLFLLVFLRLRVFASLRPCVLASKFLTQDFIAIVLVINSDALANSICHAGRLLSGIHDFNRL